MAGFDLKQTTISQVGQLLQRRELSPVELLQKVLERVEAFNSTLGVYTTITEDYALEHAKEAEGELLKGRCRGPLHGIPYSLKDLICTAGIRTTYGYRSHQDYIPPRSANVHSRLEDAGAVLVGKVDSHFRRGVPVRCRNPWDLSRSPGISSSGSGAGLAASLCLASLGSDTGGSVRIPAAYCGVVGFRATFGLISRENALGPSWSFDQVGPMAKTVEDVAVLLQAIAGHDPEDAVSLVEDPSDYPQELPRGITGLRVGVPQDFFWENSCEEVETLVRRAIEVLEGLGCEVLPVSLPHMSDSYGILSVITHVETAVGFPKVFPPWRLENLDPDVQDFIEQGRRYSIADYLEAKRVEAIVRQELARALKVADVIVTPTCPTPALLISESAATARVRGRDVNARLLQVMYTAFASVTGLPALSLPCGFASGLPVGLQIVGRRLEDALVLRTGYAYEQATEWHLRLPDETVWSTSG